LSKTCRSLLAGGVLQEQSWFCSRAAPPELIRIPVPDLPLLSHTQKQQSRLALDVLETILLNALKVGENVRVTEVDPPSDTLARHPRRGDLAVDSPGG
jgi:hypothetical protein